MNDKLIPWIAAIVLAALPLAASADGVLKKIPTRPDVRTTLFWDPADNPSATVLLFPGGDGGFGKVVDGRASSGNFLVRSAQHFRANGFNVAIFGRPSDKPELDYPDRISDNHVADIRAVLAHLKTLSPAPVWLVGTSRGTISATAAAINIKDAGITGIVLTSSVVSYSKVGAVPTQNLAAIGVPVLVLHHAKDACRVTLPHEVRHIVDGLTNAPVKKAVMVDGGGNPAGDPCEAMHWHGFIGMEEEAVSIIGNWIRNPLP
ncbi:alpha/beta hydrolase [Noviherbaspirillum sp. ST9]|uniref:alpha/beta hydrolase n=1 Tax=Noviherbaspirillum sp. ST9 TaxID=3401606 RepID=UPI003B589655